MKIKRGEVHFACHSTWTLVETLNKITALEGHTYATFPAADVSTPFLRYWEKLASLVLKEF